MSTHQTTDEVIRRQFQVYFLGPCQAAWPQGPWPPLRCRPSIRGHRCAALDLQYSSYIIHRLLQRMAVPYSVTRGG